MNDMDVLLRGAQLVDGTGAPARPADVRISAGRVAEVGVDLAVDGAQVVDLDGLVLAPGFIDPHTHYDAQVLWDPDLSPSSWHGVTTVITGNCGFGIAPTKPAHRPLIMRTLENVEGMPLNALEVGIPWGFESFPEYLDLVESTPTRCNIGVLAGHTPLRFFVLGEEATERAATADELATMRRLLSEAVDAGAVGFSSSRTASHVGAYGKPVPSRLAELDEVRELAGVLKEQGRGTLQSTWAPDLFVEEFAQIAREIDRPVSWAALMVIKEDAGYAKGIAQRVNEAGGAVHPQIACRPIVVQLTLADPAPLANVPAFEQALGQDLNGRKELYADPEWRQRARTGLAERWGTKLSYATVQETEVHEALRDGPTLAEIGEATGRDALDVMCDLALAEDLGTRFRLVMVNDDEEQIGELLKDHRFLLGLSDAGAHTSQLCDANYCTYLLQRFVRELGVLTLEDAVWRLTGHPAEVYGIADRGVVRAGAYADLVAFDPDRVGTGDLERRYDFPAGADRLVAQSAGIEHMWVNGEQTRRDGVDLEEVRPGRLLRHGR
jgi:N-acyl-D-amino-acid deacylase